MIWQSLGVFFLVAVVAVLLVARSIYYKKGLHLWVPNWLARKKVALPAGKKHIILAFVDHYEPKYQQVSKEQERARVDRWVEKYPKMAAKFKDSDGVHPQHSFFYPDEEYEREHLDKVADICRAGFGEIEIHLHHHDDTEANFCNRISTFVDILRKDHDALPIDPATGKPVFAFIHGNWCLDNSSPDGRNCGINNELTLLRQLGCYADFTFPSAPDLSQPSKINSIYYATDDPHKPKSHDTGADVKVGGKASGDLLLINGPLGLNFKWNKFGFVPRIDNADIRVSCPTIKDRVDFWVDQHIHVQGRPEWIFIKIHTHGTQERDEEALLGELAEQGYRYIEQRYMRELQWGVHYVSAREMFNIVKAAEAGESGDPGKFRDYLLPKPKFAKRAKAN
jgi:hypothetical protein